MTLCPLPELDLEVEGGKVSFDERQEWLPEDDAGQNFLEDEFNFQVRLIARGQKQLIL